MSKDNQSKAQHRQWCRTRHRSKFCSHGMDIITTGKWCSFINFLIFIGADEHNSNYVRKFIQTDEYNLRSSLWHVTDEYNLSSSMMCQTDKHKGAGHTCTPICSLAMWPPMNIREFKTPLHPFLFPPSPISSPRYFCPSYRPRRCPLMPLTLIVASPPAPCHPVPSSPDAA
jgi:hypothetical protein